MIKFVEVTQATAITHGGLFHADEVMATVILEKVFGEISLNRAFRVPEDVDSNVIVYDIGFGDFDHHQQGGNGCRENGVPYAAAGLIWKEFGHAVVAETPDPEYIWEYIDKNLIQGIDAVDCGVMPKADYPVSIYGISSVISGFNPTWDSDEKPDDAFMKAVEFARVIFDNIFNGVVSTTKAKNIVEEAKPLETPFGTLIVPSDFHHGLVILLHTCCHFTSEGIGLRQLCDWAVFVSHFTDDEFCDMFEEKLKSIGLWRFAQVLTQVCTECLGLPERSFAGERDEVLVQDFISDIFKSGNLGQKNATSVQESVLSQKNSNKSFLCNVISSINEIVYFYWGFTRKFKILLPLGWLFFGGRYVLRSLVGKRPKIEIKKLKDRTDARNSLYEEIKLFKE